MEDINNVGEGDEGNEVEPEGEELNANYEDVNPTKRIRLPF